MSSPITTAPSLINERQVALPIPPAAPVTMAILPLCDGSIPADLESFACSRLQYSNSNISDSDKASHPPSDSPVWIVHRVCLQISEIILHSLVVEPKAIVPFPHHTPARGAGSVSYTHLRAHET